MTPPRSNSSAALVVPVALLLAGCWGECPPFTPCEAASEPAVAPPPRTEPPAWPVDVGPGTRPAMLRGPADWDGVEPLPLVLLLHGYSASATLQDLLFDLSGQVDERRFLLLLPDGTVDDGGDRFWNATDACCDFGGTGVDDVGYLSGLIEVVAQDFAVDSDAVFVTGHSNGGFMSYRLACDRPDLFAAIAPLAGATWQDEARCPATTPVSVLHIHGTLDADVPYEGEDGVHPGARESVMRWVTRGGCAETSQPGDPLDLVANLPSPDTDVEEWTEGCAGGTGMALWTLADGGHIPILDDSWAPALLDWLFAHRR